MRRVDPESLRTERLLLRPYGPEDEADMLALVTDPEVMRFVGDGPATPERALAVFQKIFQLYEQGAWGIWAVEELASGRYSGSAEIKPCREEGWKDDWEVVYILAQRAWKQGYATEIGRELLRYGFERLELPRVIATVDYDNAVSIRVLEKIGMRFLAEAHDEIGAYAIYGVGRDEAGEPP
jgi:RimJ/RimL family protein N-acetyltransferase